MKRIILAVCLLAALACSAATSSAAPASELWLVTSASGDPTVPNSLPWFFASHANAASVSARVRFDASLSGATIALSSPLEVRSNWDVDLHGCLAAPEDDLPEPVEINGGGTSGLFRVGGNGRLALAHVKLANAWTPDGGAAVYVDGLGTLAATDVTFSGNVAAAGGAIYNKGGSVVVSRSTFVGNGANAASGGAVCNWAETDEFAHFVADHVLFAGNSAAMDGGAVSSVAADSGEAQAVFTSCTFVGNSVVSGTGGAVVNQEGASTAVLNSLALANVSGSTVKNSFANKVKFSYMFRLYYCSVDSGSLYGVQQSAECDETLTEDAFVDFADPKDAGGQQVCRLLPTAVFATNGVRVCRSDDWRTVGYHRPDGSVEVVESGPLGVDVPMVDLDLDQTGNRPVDLNVVSRGAVWLRSLPPENLKQTAFTSVPWPTEAPSDGTLAVQVERDRTLNLHDLVEARPPTLGGGQVFTGTSEGYEGVRNVVTLVNEDGSSITEVRDFAHNRIYRVMTDRNGASKSVSFSPQPYTPDEVLVPATLGDKFVPSPNVMRLAVSVKAAKGVAEPATVDVLVAYDQAADAWISGEGHTQTSFAEFAVARMNVVLANSGLGDSFRFRLVGVVAVDANGGSDFSGTLNRVTEGSGAWAAVKAARETYGADVVTTLIDTGSAWGVTGLGWAMADLSNYAGFANYAYNVCAVRSVADSDTMLHEIGHNMGAGHADETRMASGYGPQLMMFSSGYYFKVPSGPMAADYHTVMAYNVDRDDNFYYGAPYFSTPAHAFEGVPAGDPTHDNARTLAQTFAAVSAFREAKVADPDGDIPGVEPEPEPEPTPSDPDVAPLLYNGPDTSFLGGETYVGWVRAYDGTLAGLLTVKTAKPKAGFSKPAVSYVAFGEKKKQTISLGSAAFPAVGGLPQLTIPDIGTVVLGGRSLKGIDCDVQMGVDFLKTKDKAAKAAAQTRLAALAGVWTFAFETDQGAAAFTVTVDKKGKGKFAGTLPDGLKVTLTSQGVLGDQALAIPFAYAKKGSLGFVLWVKEDGTAAISDLTAFTLANGETLEKTCVAPQPVTGLADGEHALTCDLLAAPQTFTVTGGKKWTFPKQNKKLGADDPNPYGTKLAFTPKTGVVKGSLSATVPGATRPVKFTVNGVVVNGRLYGSASAKGTTPVPVVAE